LRCELTDYEWSAIKPMLSVRALHSPSKPGGNASRPSGDAAARRRGGSVVVTGGISPAPRLRADPRLAMSAGLANELILIVGTAVTAGVAYVVEIRAVVSSVNGLVLDLLGASVVRDCSLGARRGYVADLDPIIG
jgi:hypothetical protein